MAVTTLERATPRERSWAAEGSAALTVPVWVDPVRPAVWPAPAEPAMGVVIPLRPVPEAGAPAGVRLTRRGRLSLTLATAGCILAVAAVAMSSSAAADRPAPAHAPAASVIVAPGDTLWDLAVRADPQADPRVTVARIIDLNDLAGGQIRPGQKLQLPAH